MDYNELIVEKKDFITIITLNAPDTLNALGLTISKELENALEECEKDSSVRVIILKGEGRAFSSGGNLKEMKESLTKDPVKYIDDLTKAVYGAIDKIQKISKPVIGSVHGFAYGAGMNLALACDIVIATETTTFSESFVRIGLIAAGHATSILPKLISLKKATELCLLGQDISAEEALNMGLINKVVPEVELEEATMEIAEKIAAGPPLAIQATKKLLIKWFTQPGEKHLEEERKKQIEMAKTNDFKEGINAFFEKRKAKFKGK